MSQEKLKEFLRVHKGTVPGIKASQAALLAFTVDQLAERP